MNVDINFNGCSECVSVQKIFFIKPVLLKVYFSQAEFSILRSNHVVFLLPNQFHNSYLSCVYALVFCDTTMTDDSIEKPMDMDSKVQHKTVKVLHCSGASSNKGCFKNIRVRNSHFGNSEPTADSLSSSELFAPAIEATCHQGKPNCMPSLSERRDSFSSSSSDSAVYCSSRHVQDSASGDMMNHHHKNDSVCKKRQRNSSGSSALSSASDSSSKGEMLSCETNILSCIEKNKKHDFSKLKRCISSKGNKQAKSSISCYPEAVTNESEITFVEEQSVSYTCKKSASNVGFHNLRRQIRKKTCHNCDCNGSHTTTYVRRYTQIKRATTTTTTTNHGLQKLKSLHEVLPAQEDHLPEKFITVVEPCNDDSSEAPPPSTQNEKRSRRRRTEMDRLYDALHEIQWAKHMSPDNILRPVDFGRTPSLSASSNKNKITSAHKFKPPLSLEKNHYTRNSKKPLTSGQYSRMFQNSSKPLRHEPQRLKCQENGHKTRKERLIVEDTSSQSSEGLQNNCHLPNTESACINNEAIVSKEIDVSHDHKQISQPMNNNKTFVNAGSLEKTASDLNSKDEMCIDLNQNVNGDTSNIVVTGCPRTLVVDNSEIITLVIGSDQYQIWNILTNHNLDCSEAIITHVEPSSSDVRVQKTDTNSHTEDIIMEEISPDIVDIETSNICFENTDQAQNPVISSIPILTEVEPPSEHLSMENPPHLEPVQLPANNTPPCEGEVAKVSLDVEKNLNASETVHDIEQSLISKNNTSEELYSPKQGVAFDPKGENISQSARFSKKCQTISRSNRVRKAILRKYLMQSKHRLKHSSNSLSSNKLVDELEEIYIDDIPDTSPQTDRIPISSVSSLGEEDRKNLIKNDSLRVRLHDLNHVSFQNHLQQYNIFKCDSSFACSMMQRSQMKSSKDKVVKITEQEASCTFHHEKKEHAKPVKKKAKTLPLEYKKTEGSIPFTFVVHYKFITVSKNDGYTQVILKQTEGQNTYLSAKSLNELKKALNSASADSECQVLILNSIGRSFCLGLDLKPLIESQKTSASREIAFAVKNFIEALAAFNKPLVVVVNGAAVGLGVTLLTYSDIILSSECASYHMPYSKLGFCPEGGATLMLPYVVGSTVAMDMLLRGRTLSAYEACGYGLVSEVLSASRLPLRLVQRVQQLAESPSSVLETTKSMLRTHLYPRLSAALESETVMLQDQWLSESCQTALHQMYARNSLGFRV